MIESRPASNIGGPLQNALIHYRPKGVSQPVESPDTEFIHGENFYPKPAAVAFQNNEDCVSDKKLRRDKNGNIIKNPCF